MRLESISSYLSFANDTVNAIPRLLDLGVEKNMLAEAINCIIAQRLVPVRENGELVRRSAIFETLMFSDAIRTAIKSERSTNDIRRIAISEGMVPLHEHH